MVRPADGILRDPALLAAGREADLMSLGTHCTVCRQLDLLPTSCARCGATLCGECAGEHRCAAPNLADRVVPRCPDCNELIVLEAGATPAEALAWHLGSGCCRSRRAGQGAAAAGPAVTNEEVATGGAPAAPRAAPKRKKGKAPRCGAKGCKERLIGLKITCPDCGLQVCPRHRFAADHNCPGAPPARRPTGATMTAGLAALSRLLIAAH